MAQNLLSDIYKLVNVPLLAEDTVIFTVPLLGSAGTRRPVKDFSSKSITVEVVESVVIVTDVIGSSRLFVNGI